MKSVKYWFSIVLLIALLSSVALAAQWTGWILDQKCAEAGIHEGDHSHHVSPTNPAVFLNESDRKVFVLKDSGSLDTLLGKKVIITGDASSDTIRVTSIKKIKDDPLSSPEQR